jgi:hypothetical protein
MTENEFLALKKAAVHFSREDSNLKEKAVSLLELISVEIPLPSVLYHDIKAKCKRDKFKESLAFELAIYYLEYIRVGKDENKIPRTYRTNLEKARVLFEPIFRMYDLEHPIMSRAGRFYWFKADKEMIEILNTIINV